KLWRKLYKRGRGNKPETRLLSSLQSKKPRLPRRPPPLRGRTTSPNMEETGGKELVAATVEGGGAQGGGAQGGGGGGRGVHGGGGKQGGGSQSGGGARAGGGGFKRPKD
ncbi:MAG: hypothetical protein ACHQIK_18905, partial [Candidatus Acidiferrales bacterium]